MSRHPRPDSRLWLQLQFLGFEFSNNHLYPQLWNLQSGFSSGPPAQWHHRHSSLDLSFLTPTSSGPTFSEANLVGCTSIIFLRMSASSHFCSHDASLGFNSLSSHSFFLSNTGMSLISPYPRNLSRSIAYFIFHSQLFTLDSLSMTEIVMLTK